VNREGFNEAIDEVKKQFFKLDVCLGSCEVCLELYLDVLLRQEDNGEHPDRKEHEEEKEDEKKREKEKEKEKDEEDGEKEKEKDEEDGEKVKKGRRWTGRR
jgi:hypothetical protein